MAVYKVPQDVEAEDKLLGPFSFKQFIFLIITVAAIAMAVGLSRINILLFLLPTPIILLFGTLALPLRKDQPMEVYLAAIISFILKPKVRTWYADGIVKLIEVVAPREQETQYGKGYSQDEVQRRLSYLANVVDSRGWSVRGSAEPNSSMQPDLYNEARSVYDHFDDDGDKSRQIDELLAKSSDNRRQQLIQSLQTPEPVKQTYVMPQYMTQPITNTYSSFPQTSSPTPAISTGYTPMAVVPSGTSEDDIKLAVNPYPSMNQSVLQPLGTGSQASNQPIIQTPQTVQPMPIQNPTPAPPQHIVPEPLPAPTPKQPSQQAVSPAIIDLANNHKDLSVETLAREAERIKKKELELKESEEIFISLR